MSLVKLIWVGLLRAGALPFSKANLVSKWI